ncbi:MAG: monomethylamine:corrinoid methyltransferase [Syntrophales bacterium]
MSVSFWEMIERSRTGEKMEEKGFDLSIFKSVQRLIKKYNIKYDKAQPLPKDDDLADAVMAAAIEFYSEIGTFCINTARVIRFTEREIREGLDALPSEVTLGEGREVVTLRNLKVEGVVEPVVIGGLQTAIYSSEEMMYLISKATAEEPSIDGLWGGGLKFIDGQYPIIAGLPSEVYAYRQTALILRRAINAAGRPGLMLINNAPTSVATLAMADPINGLRPTDPSISTGCSEMKITYDDLNRVAFALSYSKCKHAAHNSVIGGFSGTPEGAAIVSTAGALQCVMVNRADDVRPGAVPFRVKSRGLREHIWVGSLALQALSRNTHLILDASLGNHPAAGPGTKQYMYENAAGQIAGTVSGGHSLSGTRKFVIGDTPDYGSPLESRWMGEITKSVTGMSREQANEIVLYLLAIYEDHLMDAPEGHVFKQLYDIASMKPTPEYERLYDEVKEEFVGLGVKFKSWSR